MEKPTKILVVDDEPGMRDLLTYELSALAYHVVTAADGEEALEKIRGEKFDLVISDVKMPCLGGLEMLEAIRKTDPDIEVIMTTGYGTIEMAVRAMKKGAYDFVQKPFNFEEILALVEKALEKNELRAILGIYEASKAVFSSIKLESLLPVIARISVEALEADDASIMLMGQDGCLEIRATFGLSEDERKRSRLQLGERVAGEAAQCQEPLVITGGLDENPRFRDVPGARDIRSAIVLPLAAEGEAPGILNINRTNRPEPFTSADLRHATVLASQITQALRNAKLYRELEEKIREIQEMQKMQRQLVQSEKLAAAGRLVAGVAHEINNPLTGILGFAEFLLSSDGLTVEQREDMQNILHQGRRCREIVQNLMKFSRRAKPREEVVALEGVLEAALELVRHDFQSKGIEIRTEIPARLPALRGDPGQLEQVFFNVAVNALHAMAGRTGGLLRIIAAHEADKITIRFEDNGCGISAQDLGKVFDPFFTTKPGGKGSGLGLSISYGIVHAHHGTMLVESEPGAGTTFIVELPLLADKP